MKNLTPEAVLRRQMRRSLVSCIVLLVVIVASTVSLGWFAKITNLSASTEMQIRDDVVSSIPFTAYIFDEEDNMVKESVGTSVTMPAYDTVFVEKNTMNSLIYRIPAFGNMVRAGGAFDITISLLDLSDETGYDDFNYHADPVDPETGDPTGGDPVIANYLSNVVFVRLAVIDGLQDISEMDTTTVYESALAFFRDAGNASAVTTHTFFEGTAGAKTGSVVFTVSDYEYPEGADYLNVYVEIGYDETLIEAWLDANDMSITAEMVGTTSNEVDILSDFDRFAFSVHENGEVEP